MNAADLRQRAASDPGAIVFVTANAGSGKTKVLIDRIARLLLAGGAPSSFLCITYTKAAAAEMQRRLFERLGKWSVADDTTLTADLAALLGGEGEMPRERLARARALFARALETPGGLRIQTIHAFCERLLRRFPLEAGAPAGFEVMDEALLARFTREAFLSAVAHDEGAREAAMRLSTRLDGERMERFAAALSAHGRALQRLDYTSCDAPTLRQRIHIRFKATSVDEILAAFSRDAPDTDLIAAARALERGGKRDLGLAEKLREAVLLRGREGLEARIGAFLKDDGEPRLDCPTKKMRDGDGFIDRLFNVAGGQGAAMRALSALRAVDCAEETYHAVALARALSQRVAARKEGAGLLDFDDLIHKAQTLLNGEESAAWVLYKLDGAIDHILVDEGQDTSPSQWALLAPLQEEFFAGLGARETRRTMFAVGDPKQSIYSFQGADPRRFRREAQELEARARAAGRQFVAPELSTSFRSTPEVLDAVDALISVLPDTDDGLPVFDGARHEAARKGEAGLVEWWPAAPRPPVSPSEPWDAPLDSETDADAAAVLTRAIARLVRRWIDEGQGVWEKGVLRPMRPGDVMALVRQRGPMFHNLMRAFRNEGLPIAGADRLVLAEDLAVADLLAAARVALDPQDDLSLACLIKSPLIGLTDDDAGIGALALSRVEGESLAARLQREEDPRWAPAKALIAWIAAHRADTPFDFFAGLLERRSEDGRSGWVRFFERLGEGCRDALQEVLGRALSFAETGPVTLHRFVHVIVGDDMPIKRELDDGGEAIRVMTVHGSKGLEAPVVILADTTRLPNGQKEPELHFDEYGPLLLERSGRADDAVCAARRAVASAAAAAEQHRLLYVAMTRARDRLIVAGAKSGRDEGVVAPGSWHDLVGRALSSCAAPCETPFGEGLRLGAPMLATTAAAVKNERQPEAPDWAHRAAPSPKEDVRGLAPATSRARFGPLFGDAKESWALRRGSFIHALLQRLPDVSVEDRIALACAWLGPQGVPRTAAEALAREAIAVIEAPELAPAFGPGSRAEVAVGGIGAGLPADVRVHGVVDRLLVTETEVHIIDFKTDARPPSDVALIPEPYLEQMAAYCAVLRQAFPAHTIKASLVWTRIASIMLLPDDVLADALERLRRR
jgi:ATP-dependent helicase/nuclease subunit A